MSLQFTQDQLAAVSFFSTASSAKRHMVIEAGAGAGKTQVLTERVKWLTQFAPLEKRIRPEHLFLVTFTNDAQIELKERIERHLQASSHVHVSTIDSLFSMLVDCLFPQYWQSQHTNDFAIPPKVSLIPEHTAMRRLEKRLLTFFSQTQVSDTQLGLIIDFILAGGFKKTTSAHFPIQNTMDSVLKCMCQDVFLACDPEKIRIAARRIHPATEILISHIHSIARQEYNRRLLQGEMTYADRTVFLKENLTQALPFVLKELIVDEYQDTNKIQHDILFRMVEQSKARMVVVGDPKQSIYGFRGASVDVFQNLTHDPLWQHVVLNHNFRSQPALLEHINLLSDITFQWSSPKFPDLYRQSFFHQLAEKKHTPSSPLIAGKTQANISSGVSVVTASVAQEKNPRHKLKDYALHAYCDFLNQFKQQHEIDWNDMVILCEKNSQIQDLIPVLQTHNIPIANYDEHNQNNTIGMEDHVALALCKYLAQHHSKNDLYLILNSPLALCTHHDIELYLTNQTLPASIAAILSCLDSYVHLAKKQFFLAWQQLRWHLVQMHEDPLLFKKAFLFCSHMHFFAKSFFNELQNPNIRSALESGSDFFPLPDQLKNWNIQKTKHHPLCGTGGIEIKTVHGAKGLQWPHVCFYPKYGKAPATSEFIVAQSESHLDVTWLNTDTEKLSVVSRVENNKFQHDDYCLEKEKPIWFSVLRKKAEEDFERQRVFYTAFTRAEQNLILFQPAQSGLTKSGFLDAPKTAKKKTSAEDYLEKETYKKFLHSNPSNINTFAYESVTRQDFVLEPEEHVFYAEDKSNHDFFVLPSIQPTTEKTFARERKSNPFSQIEQKIKSHQDQQLKMHKGIVYHAAAENAVHLKKSFQEDWILHAENAWHELEIWQKSTQKVLQSSRFIIDLIMLFKTENFHFLFPEFTKKIDHDHIVFVVDFKTGQPDTEHKKQVEHYLALIQTTRFQNLNAFFVGGIFYTSNKQWEWIYD